MKGVLAVAFPPALLVMTGGAVETTVIFRVAVPDPRELLALIVTLDVPCDVGVPEITPVAELIVNPPGRPVAAKDDGALLAEIG